MSDGTENMNKAQRLELAAAEAPLLRNASEKTLARRVALVDKDGKVTGYTSGREVLKGLAKANELEHVVQEGVRPKTVICKNCGKTAKTPNMGPVPSTCGQCQATCATRGCSAIPPTGAFRPPAIRARGGSAWVCMPCARRRRRTHSTQTVCAGQGCTIKASKKSTSPRAQESRGYAPWMCRQCNARRKAAFLADVEPVRLRRRKSGLCECGAPPSPGLVHCPTCRNRKAEVARKSYAKRVGRQVRPRAKSRPALACAMCGARLPKGAGAPSIAARRKRSAMCVNCWRGRGKST